MKRVITMVLCIVMVLSLSVTAFAAGANEEVAVPTANYQKYTVTGDGVFLRPEPNTSCLPGGTLAYGTQVENRPNGSGLYTINNEGYTWYYVKVLTGLNTGKFGYVAGGYLSPIYEI